MFIDKPDKIGDYIAPDQGEMGEKEPALRGRTIHDINRGIYKTFNTEGITIPFPHRTVYVREDKNWEKH